MSNFTVKLGLENAGFHQGMQQSRRDVETFRKEVQASDRNFSAFRKTAAGVGIAAGLMFKGLVDRADNIKDLSDKFGIFSESLQKVGLIAEQNGSSLEAVAAAMNKLEIARDKALGGDQALQESFAELGITMDDLRTMGPDALMEKIGQSSMNAAPLVAVLGKNALELKITMQQLKGATADGIIKDEDIQRMAQLKDDATAIWRTFQSATASVAGPLVGSLREALRAYQALAAGLSVLSGGSIPGGKSGSFKEAWNEVKRDWQGQKMDEFAQLDKAVYKKGPHSVEGESAANGKINRILDHRTTANETREAAIKEARDSEYQKIRDKMRNRAGMSGLEIANAKRDERREKLAQERGDRRFAKKYGEEYLQELKDRQDPVKQAEAAFSKAMAKTETELQKISGELTTTNQLLGDIEAPNND
jgi:hypothetical protein